MRQKISIACADWRLVDEDLKDAVWLDMKVAALVLFVGLHYFLTS